MKNLAVFLGATIISIAFWSILSNAPRNRNLKPFENLISIMERTGKNCITAPIYLRSKYLGKYTLCKGVIK